MAIYSFRQSYITGSSGRSGMGAAAYRHSADLVSERTGEIFEYSRKKGTVHSEIALPEAAPRWIRDQLGIARDDAGQSLVSEKAVAALEPLWNAIESAERRKDAQYARETLLALPIELTREENIELVRGFVAEHMTAKGYIVDWAFHEPDKDQKNPHVHILSTLRPLTDEGFGQKRTLRHNSDGEIVRTKKGIALYDSWAGGKPELAQWREGWALHANLALARAGHDVQIDHRSHEDRGIDREAGQHHGRSTYRDERGQSAEVVAEEAARRARIFKTFIDDPSRVLKTITEQQSTFDDRDIARTIHRFMGPEDDFRSLLLRVGALPELQVVLPEIHDPETGKVVQRARYTTSEIIEREAAMIESARGLALDQSFALPQDQRTLVLDRTETAQGFAYSAEQRGAIDRLSGPDGLSVMVGFAGSGKSTVLRAVKDLYEADGRTVIGAALAGKAAEGLQQSAGIEARTIASWERFWENGNGHLAKGDVFVLDEAGMVASAQMARVLQKLEEWEAKIVLVGDSRQLQPIEAGAAFRAIAEEAGYVELTGVRRQYEGWQAEASIDFGRGDALKALTAYDENGAVRIHGQREDALQATIEGWRSDWRVAADVVMIAHTNRDILALNAMARETIKADGGLTEDTPFQTARGLRSFAVGDRVLFLENSRELGIKNGTHGTVVEAEPGKLGIEVAHLPEPVRIDQEEYRHVDHGYAQTIHKSQGMTVDRVHVLATGMMDAQLSYVAMTRHREDVTMNVDASSFRRRFDREDPSIEAIFERLSRDGLKDTTLTYEKGEDYTDALRNARAAAALPSVTDEAEPPRSGFDLFRRIRGFFTPSDLDGERIEIRTPVRVPSPVPLVRSLPEDFTPIVARLDHVQAHSDAMGNEGNARRRTFAAAENALHEGRHSNGLREWSQDLSDIVSPSTVLAIGRAFDADKARTLMPDARPETIASLGENWLSVHAVSRAAWDVGLIETAHQVWSSHRADLEAERVEREYRAGLARQDAPEPKPETPSESVTRSTDGNASSLRETTGNRTAVAAPTPPRPPLIPAVLRWSETVDETVARKLPLTAGMVGVENHCLTSVAKTWRDPEIVWPALRSEIVAGDIGALNARVRQNPESFGDLVGSNRFLRGPNEERQAALSNLGHVTSYLTVYSEARQREVNGLLNEEVRWRDVSRTEVPDLSPGAKAFSDELRAFSSDRRAALFGNEPYERRTIDVHSPHLPELRRFHEAIEERFGKHRTAADIPGLDAERAAAIDQYRESLPHEIHLADAEIQRERETRSRSIERERDGPEIEF